MAAQLHEPDAVDRLQHSDRGRLAVLLLPARRGHVALLLPHHRGAAVPGGGRADTRLPAHASPEAGALQALHRSELRGARRPPRPLKDAPRGPHPEDRALRLRWPSVLGTRELRSDSGEVPGVPDAQRPPARGDEDRRLRLRLHGGQHSLLRRARQEGERRLEEQGRVERLPAQRLRDHGQRQRLVQLRRHDGKPGSHHPPWLRPREHEHPARAAHLPRRRLEGR
mmetsp:Transcript_73014/g.157908  ORF Transcript_73014/g.157908 Transcript_73014/m.157908 type:complete len:225 (+) Transcript_73014:209-883(+)